MASRTSRTRWLIVAALPLLVATGCTTKKSEAPAIAGPSELGLSLQMTASPDVLTMDGESQSAIAIVARNANGQPQGNIGLRVETRVGAAIVDIGRLSTKFVTTSSDGRASVTFTAPSSPPEGNSDSGNQIVTIRVVPVGGDYSNAVERSVDIRLLSRGVILPPAGVPLASFVFSPASPTEGQSVAFDASASRDCPADAVDAADCAQRGTSAGLSYKWTFGDGTTGVGVQASHAYQAVGSYAVTLTVANERGSTASVTKFVEVKVSPDPATVDFVFSPESPEALQAVFFNASLSKAAPGRTLVAYDWTFGDGATASGVTVTHRFPLKGSYNVVLTVTDDVGKTSSVSKTVTIGDDQVPKADFVISPSSPAVNDLVNFDGAVSTPPPGRTLSRWEWSFGDGGRAEGERVTHRYTASGNYTIVLTVFDSSGAKSTAQKQLSIGGAQALDPTACFSSTPPTTTPANVPVTFDASCSSAQGGTSIQAYLWTLGDGNTRTCPGGTGCSGSMLNYMYVTSGNFTVQLVVTDSAGRTSPPVTRQLSVTP